MPDDIDAPRPAGKPSRRKRRARRRGPAPATPQSLEKAAFSYLSRFAASSEHLRRLLLRRVARSARAHGTDPEDGAAAVETLISRLTGLGLLDDAAYATGMARSLLRRGSSRRAIGAKLAAKGVSRAEIEAAVAALGEETRDPDLAAALALARRRRLGPFRAADARPGHRERDLAALGRQGFALGLARRVIDAEDVAALEAEAAMES